MEEARYRRFDLTQPELQFLFELTTRRMEVARGTNAGNMLEAEFQRVLGWYVHILQMTDARADGHTFTGELGRVNIKVQPRGGGAVVLLWESDKGVD